MKNLIKIENICSLYDVEVTFIRSLGEYGLIEIIRSENSECIEEERLKELERIFHLHYDLEINLEGIDAISHMLKRMEEMQHELINLRNRLQGTDL